MGELKRDKWIQTDLFNLQIFLTLWSSNGINNDCSGPSRYSESASSAPPNIEGTLHKRHRRKLQDRSRPNLAAIPLPISAFPLFNRSPVHPPGHCKAAGWARLKMTFLPTWHGHLPHGRSGTMIAAIPSHNTLPISHLRCLVSARRFI